MTYEFEATTPRGRRAVFLCREGTNDQSTAQACVTEDEYGLRGVDLGAGVAIDIGAHIGGATIALALDNVDARVIAVEALGANVEMLRMNIELNGVSDRVTVIHAAIGKGQSTRIAWDHSGTPAGQHHRFIGNLGIVAGTDHKVETVPTVTLATLVEAAGGRVQFLKTDCEGCEYDLVRSPAVGRVDRVVGEYHAGSERLAAALAATHNVSTDGVGLGHFEAVAR